MSVIAFHASAVFRVRDGYTGAAIRTGGLQCSLDGLPCRPVQKKEGYLVLLDLAPGTHRLTLRCRGYADETVEFDAGERTLELDVTMKPGRGYPFRHTVTTLTVAVTAKDGAAADRQLWLAYAAGPEIKLAQQRAEAGENTVRLFTKYPDAVTAPAAYLLEDGDASEIVLLRSLEGESGAFAEPLARSHSRGKRLLPAQSYRTSPDGALRAVFTGPCEVIVFDREKGIAASGVLGDGENVFTAEL